MEISCRHWPSPWRARHQARTLLGHWPALAQLAEGFCVDDSQPVNQMTARPSRHVKLASAKLADNFEWHPDFQVSPQIRPREASHWVSPNLCLRQRTFITHYQAQCSHQTGCLNRRVRLSSLRFFCVATAICGVKPIVWVVQHSFCNFPNQRSKTR
jgi:hypothetical protein